MGCWQQSLKICTFPKQTSKWSGLFRQVEILVIFKKDAFGKSPGILRPCQTIIGMRKHIIYKISKNSPLSLQLCNPCKPVISFPNRVHQFEKHRLLLFSVVMDKSLIAKQNKQDKRGNVTEFQKCILVLELLICLFSSSLRKKI